MEWIWGIGLGVIASVIGGFIHDKIKQMQTRDPALAIEGTWGEFVPKSEGHQYTLGRIYFDIQAKRYAFDGTNFFNDGRPFCHFETVASHVDPARRKFFYVFTASVEGESDRVYYGFGVVNLAPQSTGELAPVDGHYVSDSIDGEGMGHTMKRLDDLTYDRGVPGQVVIEALSI